MPPSDIHIKKFLSAIEAEEKEEVKRYSLNQQHTLKSLKAEGLALHPISVIQKNFGYADYPEISFRLAFPADTHHFRDGSAIECFCAGEEPVKAILLNLDGRKGEMRLFAPDFPDWIEDDSVGIKLTPDQRTITIMKNVLNNLENNQVMYPLFQKLHERKLHNNYTINKTEIVYKNKKLNQSQQQAVKAVLDNENLLVIHGPPGTGKTTTLTEAIVQLIKTNAKIVVSAPSNTAVDTIAKSLLQQGLHILRVGNITKTDEAIFSSTPEGKLSGSKLQKPIKELKKRAEEFRRMALKYKRSFGKAEREQRNLLFKEVKNIRTEIKNLQAYNEEKLYGEAQIILGTPIGLHDAKINHIHFDTLIIDEAGQCIEPLAWCVFPLAERYVLAGDHLQLPPTILSNEAAAMGLDQSILETAIAATDAVFLLDTQYRMRESIAGFSGEYFYYGLLKSAAHLGNNGVHVIFIDTAGSGYNETAGSNGASLQNEGELLIAKKITEAESLAAAATAFISPYSGQVAAAKEMLPVEMKISTIDSFQGQEKETVILSLVRSNDDHDIGFLKDYRRMNVALTRAKEQLFVIGDSATIGADTFYNSFLTYVEKNGNYRTIWEFEL